MNKNLLFFFKSFIVTVVFICTNFLVFAQVQNWIFRDYAIGKNAADSNAILASAMMSDIQKINGEYILYYSVELGDPDIIAYATSNDLHNWLLQDTILKGSTDTTDREYLMGGPRVIKLDNGQYRMFYRCAEKYQSGNEPNYHIRTALSNDGINFTKEGISIEIGAYDANSYFAHVGHSAFFRNKDGNITALLTAKDTSMSSTLPDRIYYAVSYDEGLNWEGFSPIYEGCHDPVVVKDSSGEYQAFFTYLTQGFRTVSSTDGNTWPTTADTLFFMQSSDTLTEATLPGIADLGAAVDSEGTIYIFSNYHESSGVWDNIAYYTKNVLAYFYQYVGEMDMGTGLGNNKVLVGTTNDGIDIKSETMTALDWYVGPGSTDSVSYGDPVFSYLSKSGNWIMTSWSSPDDPRGGGVLLYHESPCPVVVDSNVVAIGNSFQPGCRTDSSICINKTSQVFEAGSSTYMFHPLGTFMYLANLSDSANSAIDLPGLCLLNTAVTQLSDLNYGESTMVFDSDSLFLADPAIAKRTDGTWVLFCKGIDTSLTYDKGSFGEVCSRGIYRTTSTDLINWMPLEKVVSQASVPEASTTADGKVWLYWQDFSIVCDLNDTDLVYARLAPIAGAYEMEGTYELSEPTYVYFSDEAFENDSSIHYATNGNPILLHDQDAIDALRECIQTHSTSCSINTALTVSAGTIISNEGNASYQWLDCNNSWSAIIGATDSSYTPSVSGSFAVEITQGSCVDTSSCETILVTKINDKNKNSNISIHPNPSNGLYTISIDRSLINQTIEVRDLLGKSILIDQLNSQQNVLDISEKENGIYFIKIFNKQFSVIKL